MRESEGQRERNRTEEKPGREKNDCFHDYNGERKRKRGDGPGRIGQSARVADAGKAVWGAIS